jgi:hypothetical protein
MREGGRGGSVGGVTMPTKTGCQIQDSGSRFPGSTGWSVGSLTISIGYDDGDFGFRMESRGVGEGVGLEMQTECNSCLEKRQDVTTSRGDWASRSVISVLEDRFTTLPGELPGSP